MSNLFRYFNPLNIQRRYLIRKHKFEWQDGMKFYGFVYYPRTPDFKDPPYEPSKLFMVRRIRPVKGLPHWERTILKEFSLDGKLSDVAIIKNIPENNARLWRIKHVIQIKPITFPNGFPKDPNGTYLKENGELVVAQSLSPAEDRLVASESFEKDSRKIDGETLRKWLRKRWVSEWEGTP